jgi:hypothetical protein
VSCDSQPVREQRRLDWHSRRLRAAVPLVSAECGKVSDAHAAGWSAIRTGDIAADDPPEMFFFCPDCAEFKLGEPC